MHKCLEAKLSFDGQLNRAFRITEELSDLNNAYKPLKAKERIRKLCLIHFLPSRKFISYKNVQLLFCSNYIRDLILLRPAFPRLPCSHLSDLFLLRKALLFHPIMYEAR